MESTLEPALALAPATKESFSMSTIDSSRVETLPPGALEDLERLLGPHGWTTDADERYRHGRDGWAPALKGQPAGKPGDILPIGVVRPTSTEQVAACLAWANRYHIPVTPYGGGTGVAGGAVPIAGGISLDLGAFNQVEQVDEENLLVTVGAGTRGEAMEAELDARGFTVGHIPSSLPLSTVGGWVAVGSSGMFSGLYGNIENMVAGLEIVLPTGKVVRTKVSPRSSAGPDYKHLFISSEGTLGVITRVTLRLWKRPAARTFRALTFPSLPIALQVLKQIAQDGLRPAVVRLHDPQGGRTLLQQFGQNPDQWLLILTFDGHPRIVEIEERIVVETAVSLGASDLGPEPSQYWYQNRFAALGYFQQLAEPGTISDLIEISQSWSRLEETYHALMAATSQYMSNVNGYIPHIYAQGASLNIVSATHAADDTRAIEAYQATWKAVMQISLERGATISHHHGIGLQLAPWMADELGSGLDVLRQIKHTFDPGNIMNPNKLGL
jgi:alkyldihydroxyacetonephosphate synthase